MNQVWFGDCRDILRKLAADGVKVQMCVTSPPYFGLRDYGHDGQIGLEQTTEAYISALVDTFRAVRDVLADDGTLWLNIGDSYAGSWGNQGRKETRGTQRPINGGMMQKVNDGRYPTTGSNTGSLDKTPGCKNKDLIGIPWMLAFALRADGWYLRQEIIWHKPNPMPESIGDRCTKAHEHLFLLSKSPRYLYNVEAVKEQAADGLRNRRSVWTIPTKPYKGAHFATFPESLVIPCILAGSSSNDIVLDPFMGSGTTAAVAIQLGRQYLGCELNLEYKPLQDARILAAANDAVQKLIDFA